MNHFYQDIRGFFTWPDYYAHIAQIASRGFVGRRWHGVEVGTYTGQSAAYFAVELATEELRAGINPDEHRPRFDLVDLEMTKHRARENLARLESTGIIGRFLEMDSVAASNLYDDESLDFVFIDAEHDYKNVRRDIDAWLPKVRKNGGIIAGHDHCPDFTGVIQAVSETFPRYEVWRGMRGPGWGDQRMVDTGQYYSCWCVRV